MNRRNFLKLTGLAIAGVTVGVPAIELAAKSNYPEWAITSFRDLPEAISDENGTIYLRSAIREKRTEILAVMRKNANRIVNGS